MKTTFGNKNTFHPHKHTHTRMNVCKISNGNNPCEKVHVYAFTLHVNIGHDDNFTVFLHFRHSKYRTRKVYDERHKYAVGIEIVFYEGGEKKIYT